MICLAKGTNNMNKLVEKVGPCVHMRSMYNAIQVDKSHWNYQLYLWNNSFDISDPKWKVIKTLIYGVTSIRNQAECGLKRLAKIMEIGHEGL